MADEAKPAWVTGAAGLIGNYLMATAPSAWRARGLTREVVDLLDLAAVRELFNKEKPALVIHCAAISKNPVCDADPAMARSVNTDVTAHLAELCADIPFVFMSTDLVFDGRKGNYVETDAPNPLGVYPETKARAEEAVLRNPNHTVVRTSVNAGRSISGNRSFNEELRAAFAAGRELSLFVDEFRCPIPAEATARALWEIAGRATGIFHLCGTETLSRFEIGKLVAARFPELNPKLKPGPLKDYKGPPRAPDTSMRVAKIQKLLSFELPRFSEVTF
jgi:dTDP-4-dehydrorhamnose reductase